MTSHISDLPLNEADSARPDPLRPIHARSDMARHALGVTSRLLRRTVRGLEKSALLEPSASQYWADELQEIYKTCNELLTRVANLMHRIDTAEMLEVAGRGVLAGTEDPEKWNMVE